MADDGIMHALPVGDAALANELARVAANGERISCDDDDDDIIDWVCMPFNKSALSLLLFPPTSNVLPFGPSLLL